MANQDWFRNTAWNDQIEGAFFAKLKRSRQKAQYLKLQAQTIAGSHPCVALRLLECYFATKDEFFLAQAFVTAAEANIVLGNFQAAALAFRQALHQETVFPAVKTNAYVDYPFFVAMKQIQSEYDGALAVLAERELDLAFPLNHFKFHAARALIYAARGMATEASVSSQLALKAAGAIHSGFHNHPSLGVVDKQLSPVLQRLDELASTYPTRAAQPSTSTESPSNRAVPTR